MKPNRYTSLKSTLVALLVLSSTSGLGRAAAAASQEGGTNVAKKGSAAVKRDPFWPVGYVPKNVQTISPVKQTDGGTTSAVSSWSAAMKNVVINGVSSRADNEYCAVINGEVKNVGDTVTVRMGGSVYTWAVDGIEPPGSVKLRRVSVR